MNIQHVRLHQSDTKRTATDEANPMVVAIERMSAKSIRSNCIE